MLGAKSRSFEIDNTNIHYVVLGNGKKSLIILPGLSDGIQNVRHAATMLAFYYRQYAKHYTVYVCSRKDYLPNGYTTRDMARDIVLFIDALHIRHVHIMGISMGGMIAQHLAVNYSDHVEKLIIAVSTSKPTQTLHSVVNRWIDMVQEGRYQDFIVDMMERTYTDRFLRKYRPFYFMLKKAGEPKNIQNFLVQADACLHHEAHEQIRTINCPTLVVGGGKDEVVGPEAPELIAEQIKDCRFIMYRPLGHGATQESKYFNNHAIGFLNQST